MKTPLGFTIFAIVELLATYLSLTFISSDGIFSKACGVFLLIVILSAAIYFAVLLAIQSAKADGIIK